MIPFLLFVIFTTTYADENVKYAAIIYRHGDRTPVKTYPTDPWRNESLWPVKFGELTNIGKRQHYALGKWFRQRYSHLLSEDFDPSEIYIRSTDVDRTLMSAQANLAGMYPPNNKTTWNTEILWQPIPVHTVPENQDELLAMKKPCPAYDKELERLTLSKPYKERLSKYQRLMDYLSAYTGMKVKDYNDIDDIYYNLYIESLYNFTLPKWTQSVFPDKMQEPACYSFPADSIRQNKWIAAVKLERQEYDWMPAKTSRVCSVHFDEKYFFDKIFTTQTGSPLLARLKVGPLLKHIMAHMKDAMSASSKSSHKVVMYSGHDLTVGSVLNALGLYDGNCPTYTSTILIELLTNIKITGGYYVRISYRNSVEIVEPKVLKIPFCGEVCPVERFKKLYKNLLNVNWEDECSKEFPALLGGSFIVGLCLFIGIYVAHKIHFARVYNQQRKNMTYSSVQTATEKPTIPFEA